MNGFHDPTNPRDKSTPVGLRSGELLVATQAERHADEGAHVLQVSLNIPETAIDKTIVTRLQKVLETIISRTF